MAAPSTNLVRLRLHFDYPPPAAADCRLCWLLVDLKDCRVVADVESLIRDKFGFSSRPRGSVLRLFVDGCYVPHTESALLLRDNDTVRVKVECVAEVNGSSKRKRSRPAEEEVEEEPGENGESVEWKKKKRKNQAEETVTQPSGDERKKKKKRKKAKEACLTVTLTPVARKKSKKSPTRVEQPPKSNKKAPPKAGNSSDSSSDEEEAPKKTAAPKPAPPPSSSAAAPKTPPPPKPKQAKPRPPPSSSSDSSSDEDEAPKKIATPKPAAPKPAPPPSSSSAAAPSKTPPPPKPQQAKPRPPPSSSSDSSASSSDEAPPKKTTTSTTPKGGPSKSQQAPSKTTTTPKGRTSSSHQAPPTPRPTNGARKGAADVATPPPGNAVPAEDSDSDEEIQLVIRKPVQPPFFVGGAPWRGRGRGQVWRGGQGGGGGPREGRGGGRGSVQSGCNGAKEPNCQTDTLTNVSVIHQNGGGVAPQRDYLSMPLLAAPPQVGQKIAFKLLELTENYTPEVSEYKEGKIVSCDFMTKQIELEILTASTAPVEPGKFDLVYQNADGSESVEYAVSRGSRLTERWESLLEPRLII